MTVPNRLFPARARAVAATFCAMVLILCAASQPVRAGEPAHALVIVEQPGCHYCIRWHAEIGPAYPKTDAGAFAPLRVEQLRAPADDLTFARRVLFTPTFILVDRDGTEIGRLEGYPGQDFFWPMLERMLADSAGFAVGTPQ